MIRQAGTERVQHWIEAEVVRHKVLVGGSRNGAVHEATLVADVAPEMPSVAKSCSVRRSP